MSLDRGFAGASRDVAGSVRDLKTGGPVATEPNIRFSRFPATPAVQVLAGRLVHGLLQIVEFHRELTRPEAGRRCQVGALYLKCQFRCHDDVT